MNTVDNGVLKVVLFRHFGPQWYFLEIGVASQI